MLAGCLVGSAQADVTAIEGTYNSQYVKFTVEFDAPSLITSGWQFQLFIDSDNHTSTGYSGGYDRLVRGVELADSNHVYLRSTTGTSGPGGWGLTLGQVFFHMPDPYHLQFDVPLGSGLSSGQFRYVFESYYQGRLMASTATKHTAQGQADDCNGNGVDDSLDLSSGSSKDCDNNGRPDECDIATGVRDDCNGNNVPDECDITSGYSEDCGSDGLPDECEEDCNNNGIADSCDILSGDSNDCDDDGLPDECTPVVAVDGMRYLAIHPPAGIQPITIRVKGEFSDPSIGCMARYVQANGTLGTTPFSQQPADWCTVLVSGAQLLPNKSYTVQTWNGSTWSQPIMATMDGHLDLDDNGTSNFLDIQHLLLAFLGTFNYSIGAVDIAPCTPDGVINFTDVQVAIQSWAGLPPTCAVPCP